MNPTDILKAIGKDLSDDEQKFLKFLALYQREELKDGEAVFDIMNCAYDLFIALKNLAENRNALKAKFEAEQERRRFLEGRFESLQRAVRLARLGFKTIDELANDAHALNQGIFWDYVENMEQREEAKKC